MSNNSDYPPAVKKRLRVRRFLWYWHQRLGLVSALLVLLLAVTGIILNHTERLQLDQIPLRNSLLLNLYGIKAPEIISVDVEGEWISQLNHVDIYWNDKHSGACQGSLVGAARTSDGLYAIACSEELLLLSEAGDLLERFGAHYQLPTPLTGLGVCAQQLCLQRGERVYLADMDQLQWREQSGLNVLWSQEKTLPQQQTKRLTRAFQGSAISWERVLLDLHSGRLFGAFGVWVVDLAAMIFILLAASGFWLWFRSPGRR